MNFAIIGGSGYVAEKHYKSIKATGNKIIVVYDPVDNIGVLDRYEISAKFYKSLKQFKQFIKNSIGTKKQIDYLTICSPNYLHYEHIKIGLKLKLKIICEKPLVINISHLNRLIYEEKKYKSNISLILQLRFHPVFKKINNFIKSKPRKKYNVDLTYLAPRGDWYLKSWKSNKSKSGGIASNIGIHLFDILIQLFGDVIDYNVYYKSKTTMAGLLNLKNAKIKWILSTNFKLCKTNRPIRKIKLLKEEFNLSNPKLDLHEISYKKILENKGFNLNSSIESLKLVNKLNKVKISKEKFFNSFNKLILNETK